MVSLLLALMMLASGPSQDSYYDDYDYSNDYEYTEDSEYGDEYYEDDYYEDEYYGEEYYEDDYYEGDYYEDEYSDEYEEDASFELVRTGTLEEIKEQISESVPELTDYDGNTLLTVACGNGREIEIVSYLLSIGCNADSRNNYGETPLLQAARWTSDPAVLQLLITNGARVSSVDEDGRTMLMYAATNSTPAVFTAVYAIPGVQATVKNLDESKRSALYYACSNSDTTLDILKTLIKAGLDLNLADTGGQTPFMAACQYHSSLSIIEALIQAGGKVDRADEYGTTALMLACSDQGDAAMIQLLLKKGASLAALDDYGYSALLYAFYSPQAEALVPALIAAGADPLVVGNNGYTALMMAAQQYGFELIPSLIKARVPINAVDDEGKTALMYACMNADTSKAVEYLLDAGADKTIVDEMGYTAYDYLMENSNLSDSPLAERLAVSR